MVRSKRTIKSADVEQLGRLQCTVQEAAAFLDIRVTTMTQLLRTDKRIKRAWERGKQLGFISLRGKQMRLAGNNATMAIFLGKNYLGQRDISTHQLTGENGDPIDINVSRLDAGERNDLRKLLHRATRTGRRSKGSG